MALIGLFRSRASLQVKILTLRHQLNVLRRKSPQRLGFASIDRLVFCRVVSVGTWRSGRFEDRQVGGKTPVFKGS
ncbi:MAG TPA: hypothetical protein VNZ53_21845 [Steroidobacteraceae bacterium]|nr:hypothetical protein [Steroidobacteraceae bacterium]